MNRVTVQQWIRLGHVKAPKTIIRNGRAVRLWSRDDVRNVKQYKRGKDSEREFMKRIRAQVAELKEQRKADRQARLDRKARMD